MKTRANHALCCLIILLLGTLSGCQLAQTDKSANVAQDRLIGVFVTTGHLDLQGRLYGTQKKRTVTDESGKTIETDTYAFEGVTGMLYINAIVPATAAMDSYHTTIADDGISDRKTSLGLGDVENSTVLDGTIYASMGRGEFIFYFNPVYQDGIGRVYATAGTGLSSGNMQSDGAQFSQTMNATQTVTENGKTKKDSITIKLNIQMMNPPTKVAILRMDANNALLSREEFTPNAVPTQITLEQATDYIVVETTQSSADGTEKVTRKLVGKDATALESFWCRDDGICIKQSTQVLWPDAQPLS